MNSKDFGDVDDFQCSAGPGGWPASAGLSRPNEGRLRPAEAKPGKMSSRPAGADALLFINFIIGTVADSCTPMRDPESTPSGPAGSLYY